MKRPHFGKLQILTHIGAWIPLVVLIFDFMNDNLTANPIQAIQQRTGNIALILLGLSLACTPLNTLFRIPVLNKLQRPLGLYGYMYASFHLLNFLGLDYGFNLEQILREVGDKSYILVGLAAFIILTLLAVTSYRWWMVRLGKNWKKLHRTVYLVNVLIVLHFAWVIKGDVLRLQGDIVRPILAGIVVAVLLTLRIPAVRRKVAGKLQLPKFGASQRPAPKRPQPTVGE